MPQDISSIEGKSASSSEASITPTSSIPDKLEANIGSLENQLKEINKTYQDNNEVNPVQTYQEGLTENFEDTLRSTQEKRIEDHLQQKIKDSDTRGLTASYLDYEKDTGKKLLKNIREQKKQVQSDIETIKKGFSEIREGIRTPKLEEIKKISENTYQERINYSKSRILRNLGENDPEYKKYPQDKQNIFEDNIKIEAMYPPTFPFSTKDLQSKQSDLERSLGHQIYDNKGWYDDIFRYEEQIRMLHSILPEKVEVSVESAQGYLLGKLSGLNQAEKDIKQILGKWRSHERETISLKQEERQEKIQQYNNQATLEEAINPLEPSNPNITDQERSFAQNSINSAVSAKSQQYNPEHIQTVLKNEQANLQALQQETNINQINTERISRGLQPITQEEYNQYLRSTDFRQPTVPNPTTTETTPLPEI